MRKFLPLIIAILFATSANYVSAQDIRIVSATKKSYNGKDISCAGMKDAEITVIAAGGSGEYEYSKDDGKKWQSSNVLTGLPAGQNAIIRVRDANKETDVSNSLYLHVNTVNPVKINTWQPQTNFTSATNVSCFGSTDGALQFKADGGTDNFLYSIDEGQTWQKEIIFSGLGAGFYNGIVKDENGCEAKTTKPVELRQPKKIEAQIVEQKIADPGKSNGYMKVKGKGGDGGYNISLNGVLFTRWDHKDPWIAPNETITFENLEAKEYNLLVKDVHYSWGCTSAPIEVVLSKFKAEMSGSATVCPGNTATIFINIAGDEAAYTALYKDSNGKEFTVASLKSGLNAITTGIVNSPQVYTLISVKSISGYTGAAKGQAAISLNETFTWLGYSSDWTDAKNWSCGVLPTVHTDVLIPETANNPKILFGDNGVRNITIKNGAGLTVAGILKIAGEIFAGSPIDATSGSIEFAGKNGQKISGKFFTNSSVYNLTSSNPAGIYIRQEAGDILNITGNLKFGTADAAIYTGDNITLKSTVKGTANLGYVGKGNKISGKITVERFVNLGTDKELGQHTKAWMLLSTPAKGQSIRDSWQEGAVSTGKTPIANPNPGYGAMLTTGYNNVPANGFDVYTGPGPSIKIYNSATNSFDKGPVSTFEQLYNPKGYMVLVRGDRSVYTSTGKPVPTTLRSKGEVVTGDTEPIKVGKDKFESVGNPYPSAVYLDQIEKDGIDDVFFVWDPKLGGNYGMGGYQAITSMLNGTYIAIPGGGSYGNEPVRTIESGTAFLVQTTKQEGSLRFTEEAKVSNVPSMLRRQGVNSFMELRTSLYGVSGETTFLTDGNLLHFDNSFSNEIDGLDNRKPSNTSENFSIFSNGINLAVERRKPLTTSDTIFFRLSGVQAQAYQFEFKATNMLASNLEAWLEDTYLKTKVRISMDGKTVVPFSIENIPGSYAANRFQIVFKPLATLPVTITKITAQEKYKDVVVRWDVENESGMSAYMLEKSVDGKVFFKADEVRAENKSAGSYEWLDTKAQPGNNYYRLISMDKNGKSMVSEVVKVFVGTGSSLMKVYPNPASDAKVMIEVNEETGGVYYYQLINPLGQTILADKFVNGGGFHQEEIRWNRASARGNYQLIITTPASKTNTINIVY